MAGPDHHGEHTPGAMDISGHEKTFAGFIRLTTWAVGIVIAVLIFMALANA